MAMPAQPGGAAPAPPFGFRAQAPPLFRPPLAPAATQTPQDLQNAARSHATCQLASNATQKLQMGSITTPQTEPRPAVAQGSHLSPAPFPSLDQSGGSPPVLAGDADALVNGLATWQDYDGRPSSSRDADGAPQLMEASEAAAPVGGADADRVGGADAEMARSAGVSQDANQRFTGGPQQLSDSVELALEQARIKLQGLALKHQAFRGSADILGEMLQNDCEEGTTSDDLWMAREDLALAMADLGPARICDIDCHVNTLCQDPDEDLRKVGYLLGSSLDVITAQMGPVPDPDK